MTQDARSVSVPALPLRLTSFVGRVAELQQVGGALGRHRLVTLVGPGGCGKTRLAIEAARAVATEYRWFVELAPAQDGAAVGAALAVATRAPEGPGEEPLDATVRRIGDTAGLLVLDNCDQVLGGCARAVDVLLRSCPRLTVLATGREPLRVEGEHVWRVPPLSLPSDDSLDGDAVLLFLDRAGLSPDTAVRDRAAIHQICRRLDGMPLAIELAAARATALPAPVVLAGLADRFRLLTGGPRTADTRQRSLAESIRWSYRLLDDDERTVLQRLAVFQAPFTSESARAIVAGDGIDPPDVLPLLANLVAKSFVVVDEGREADQYRLLETIREYAAAELATQRRDARATRDRHLRHLRELAERIEPDFDGPLLTRWVGRFETRLPDIGTAVSWAAYTGSADDALRLVGALGWFWWVRARSGDRDLIDAALAISGGKPRWQAKALTSAAISAHARFDPGAVALGEQAVRVATTSGDTGVAAWASSWLAWIAAYLAPATAKPIAARAAELADRAADPRCVSLAATALIPIGMTDLPYAWSQGQEAVAIAAGNRNQLVACWGRYSLAAVGMLQGRLAPAATIAEQALHTAELLGDHLDVTWSRSILTWITALRGDEQAAVAHARAAEAAANATGNPLLQGFGSVARGQAAYAVGQLPEARVRLTGAIPAVSLFIGGMVGSQVAEILADADLHAGDQEAARRHAELARQLAETADNDWSRSRARLAAGRLALHDSELQSAAGAAHQALELAHHTEDRLTTIDAVELLACVAARRRSHELATRLLAAASAERERVEYVRFRLHEAAHAALAGDLKKALGDEEYATLWRQGEQLTIDAAIALSRSRRGSRNRPATGWDALTPAELRVVELVGVGLNNIQIAGRLFVTRDTVKGHVAHAFAKLGVQNRVELATLAARRHSM